MRGREITMEKTERYLNFYNFENNFWDKTLHFHRPFSYYLNLLSKHEFVLKHIEEPKSYDGAHKMQTCRYLYLQNIKKYKIKY